MGEECTVTEKSGRVVPFCDVKGHKFPAFMMSRKGFDELQKLKAREDDIIVCGYQKCGTHWITEVILMILTGTTNYSKKHKLSLMLENTIRLENGDLSSYDEMTSPRIFNTHMYLDMIPRDFQKKKCKIIYLCRNPKDVAVSLFSHIKAQVQINYTGTWDTYVNLFGNGEGAIDLYFDYLVQWKTDMESHPEIPILDLCFEDAKLDFMKQARRICQFFDLVRDDEFLFAVLDACSFDKMKEKSKHPMTTDPSAPVNSFIYRKGEVGDWKNWFTVAQNEMFDEIFREKMKGIKFEFKYVI